MKNILKNVLAGLLFITVAYGQPRPVKTRFFSQSFVSQRAMSTPGLMFHVFTNSEQMAYFFKPAIINENNASPVISERDFINQFVIAISSSELRFTKPVISDVQAKSEVLYVYYDEVGVSDQDRSVLISVAKDDFSRIVFVNRTSNVRKIIYYNDIPPIVSKIVLSYLDMPKTEAYKHEYQISIDEIGEVIAVKDENGEITSRLNYSLSPEVFENLKVCFEGLDNGGEKIDRTLPGGKKFKEILLMDDFNRVIYSLTWDDPDKVNESTKRFVKTIEKMVPEKVINFTNKTEREVASN